MFLKKIAKAALLVLSILFVAAGLLAARIYSYRNDASDAPADAAIVLGAAVWGAEVSPVFRERINHGINLYRKGKVRKLIFTGGQGNQGEPTESAAARQYALRSGIPAHDILIEEKSHTTYENILYAKQLAEAQGLRKTLIVSDPLHMKRAMAMAKDLGLSASPSPTPSTRYRGIKSQAALLAHETYYYIGYLLHRPFANALPA
ncbi:MAG TPA: YdcF family protein [Pyrinomonadaceae bacterium]|nr:YdcF family protein [Pyrinomonadaceae bacterium]